MGRQQGDHRPAGSAPYPRDDRCACSATTSTCANAYTLMHTCNLTFLPTECLRVILYMLVIQTVTILLKRIFQASRKVHSADML